MAACLNIALFGATGSIGESTLQVLREHTDRYRLSALSAQSSVGKLAALAHEFAPEHIILTDRERYSELKAMLSPELLPRVLVGEEALDQVAKLAAIDTVVCAIVGAAGLRSTLSAAQTGKRILLANKEALVVGGALVRAACEASGAQLLPLDSEHNAIFQCLPQHAGASANNYQASVARIWLTASGGPFRLRAREALRHVTPEEAVRHPNWQMGAKISVDSATMMNKGLELIEAHFLFGLEAERIEVLVHPESIVHSLVEYLDGSFLAQLGAPDMRTPIACALAWPERLKITHQKLDLRSLRALHFEAPDHERFPALSLAYQALRAEHTAPVVLNAANEIAVQAFLERRLQFTGITDAVNAALSALPLASASSLEDVLDCDQQARRFTSHWIEQRAN